MVSSRHVGARHEANVLPVDEDHDVDYDHD